MPAARLSHIFNSQPLRRNGLRYLLASALLVKRRFFASHISLPGTRRAMAPKSQPFDVLGGDGELRDSRRAALAGADPILLVIDSALQQLRREPVVGPPGCRKQPNALAARGGGHVTLGADEHRSVAGARSAGSPAGPPGRVRRVPPRRVPPRPPRAPSRPPRAAGGSPPPRPRPGRRLAIDRQLVAHQHHAVAAFRRRAGSYRPPDCPWAGRGGRSPPSPAGSGSRRACSGKRGWSPGACCREPETRTPYARAPAKATGSCPPL